MSSELKLDGEAIAPLVHKAILDSITTDQRDELVRRAIEHLLVTPPRAQYGAPQAAPLTEAFNTAIRSVAWKVVKDQIETDPEVQARILEMVSAPIAEITRGNYDGLPEKIGEAIGEKVSEWLRDRSR